MQSAHARRGDVIIVHGHTIGAAARSGVILDVLGSPDQVHYRVRWDEEHDSLYWPGSDATIRPGTRRPRAAVEDADPDPEC